MRFLDNIVKSTSAYGQSLKYKKVGYDYSDTIYSKIKNELNEYIENTKLLISTYNRRNEIERDNYGNKKRDENNHYLKPNKQLIYPLLRKNEAIYNRLKEDINLFKKDYGTNKDLKYRVNQIKTIYSLLYKTQNNFSYKERVFSGKQTTADSVVKLNNNFRWANKRKKSMATFYDLVERTKKL